MQGQTAVETGSGKPVGLQDASNLVTSLNAFGKPSALQALVLLHQAMREYGRTTLLALNGADVQSGTMLDVVDEIFGRHSFGIVLMDDWDTCG